MGKHYRIDKINVLGRLKTLMIFALIVFAVGLLYFSLLLSGKTGHSQQMDHFHIMKSNPIDDGIFKFNVKDIEGNLLSIGDTFRSKFKLMLIVNVASK